MYSTQHRLSGVLNRRLTTNPKDFGVLKIIESVLLRRLQQLELKVTTHAHQKRVPV